MTEQQKTDQIDDQETKGQEVEGHGLSNTKGANTHGPGRQQEEDVEGHGLSNTKGANTHGPG
jgi:hypothetical protein